MARLYSNPQLTGTPWADLAYETFSSWTWQLRHRIENAGQLGAVLRLAEHEVRGLEINRHLFRFAISPYYALLADRESDDCPIRKQMIPSEKEARLLPEERSDPLGEESLEAAPNLVHRYPDRVLLLATDRCAVYCRFCTRRRIVGRTERQAPRSLLSEAFKYIEKHPEIREVIVSGGDALMLGNNHIEHVLREIRRSSHVDIIRIATRMPVTCPMRITTSLVEILARYGPVYILTHFNHPRECTPSAKTAIDRLVQAGLPVWNQSVLLKGVNDRLDVVQELNRLLVWMRVVPYYLHQCDLAQGIEHFRTPLQTGLQIIEGLRGHSSGLMVPKLCVDVPGGLGKVTIQPDWIVRQSGRVTEFRTYSGGVGAYVDPEPTASGR